MLLLYLGILFVFFVCRSYVQPQWIYDCVNTKTLLPVQDYLPGAVLPPHLSPFVEEKEGDYVPPEKEALLRRQKGSTLGAYRCNQLYVTIKFIRLGSRFKKANTK